MVPRVHLPGFPVPRDRGTEPADPPLEISDRAGRGRGGERQGPRATIERGFLAEIQNGPLPREAVRTPRQKIGRGPRVFG